MHACVCAIFLFVHACTYVQAYVFEAEKVTETKDSKGETGVLISPDV